MRFTRSRSNIEAHECASSYVGYDVAEHSQAPVDVHLHQRDGLAGEFGRFLYAQPVKFHQPDHLRLRGLQPAQKLAEQDRAYDRRAVIVDGYVLGYILGTGYSRVTVQRT